ncbi:MAG TPA: hypothetical protein VGS08_04460 [Candidatus Saccharimonadales bacterium]|nr:hypothetical protein [Candidatus Saccharimonadales bacterium]
MEQLEGAKRGDDVPNQVAQLAVQQVAEVDRVDMAAVTAEANNQTQPDEQPSERAENHGGPLARVHCDPEHHTVNGPQLPSQSLIDVRLELPAFKLRRVTAGRHRWSVGRQRLAVLKTLHDTRALPSAFLNLIEVAEQVPLKLVEVARLLAQTEPGNKFSYIRCRSLLCRMPQYCGSSLLAK